MIVFDAETDNLLKDVTTIHCIVVVDRKTLKVERYRDPQHKSKHKAAGDIEAGMARVAAADEIGGHNITGYDIPVFQKLYPNKVYPKGVIRDSLIESEMWYPAADLRTKDFLAHKKKGGKWIPTYLMGKHSLKAWGARLDCPKDDYAERCKEAGIDPWAAWSDEMEDYCVQDVLTNIKLFDFLEARFDYVGAARAVEIENKAAIILQRQEQWGVAFDTAAAGKLHAKLVAKHTSIADELREKYFSPFLMRNGKAVTPKKTMKRKNPGGWIDHITEGAPYVKIKLVDFNPASRQHIYKRLMAVYGWVPTKFAEKGEPTVDESVLELLQYPPIPLLLEYLLLEKRLGQLAEGNQAWLRKEVNGRIHGRVKQNGTRTSRCSHVSPNLGQVPKVSKPYGVECRSLFGPSKGRKQMGVDLSGIEMRAQGHYLARFDGGYFAQQVVEGDVHDLARVAMQMNSRDITKTFEYAMTYGSGMPNLGAIVYSDFTDEQKKRFGATGVQKLGRLGSQRKSMLSSGLKGFKQLLDAVEQSYKKGWLRSLDGRKLAVPSKHSALNTLFQGFGGVLAKVWLVEFDRLLQENDLIPKLTWYIDPDQHDLWKVVQMLFVHDELQNDCIPEYAEQAGELAVQAAQSTKQLLGLNVDIDAEYKVGDSWAECH